MSRVASTDSTSILGLKVGTPRTAHREAKYEMAGRLTTFTMQCRRILAIASGVRFITYLSSPESASTEETLTITQPQVKGSVLPENHGWIFQRGRPTGNRQAELHVIMFWFGNKRCGLLV